MRSKPTQAATETTLHSLLSHVLVASALPHYAMILHPGEFPDGS